MIFEQIPQVKKLLSFYAEGMCAFRLKRMPKNHDVRIQEW